MFKEISSINIKGGCFKEDGIELSNLLGRPLNILFGCNGSGKSSIGRAIEEYAHTNDGQRSFEVSFKDKNGTPIELGEDAKNKIFVFNEEFINNNIKIETDGLNAILMTGAQANNAEQIEKERQNLNYLRISLSNFQSNEKGEYLRSLFSKIKKNLQTDNKYADRYKLINEQSVKGQVKEDTINDLKDTGSDEELMKSLPADIVALTDRVNRDIEQLTSLTSTGSKISWTSPNIDFGFVPEDVLALLSKSINKPELNERDSYIISLMSDARTRHFIDDTKAIIIDGKAGICPLCHQKIEPGYRDSLALKIKSVLNHDVEEHKQSLKQIIDSKIKDIIYPDLKDKTSADDIQNCQDKIIKLGKIIEKIKAQCEEKLNNPYDAITNAFSLEEFNNQLSACYKAIADISSDVDRYNDIIENKGNKKIEVIRENKYLSYLENKNDIDNYLKTKNENIINDSNITKTNGEIEASESKIRTMEASSAQSGSAMALINECLQGIFFSNERLCLKLGEGGKHYEILSNKNHVSPKNISLGERNVIALAYFFAKIFEGQDVKSRYKNNNLIIIDDPVSSFDAENRTGVVSWLGFQWQKFIKSNSENKILVMSHDMFTVKNFTFIENNIFYSLQHDTDWKNEKNLRLQNTWASFYELYNHKLHAHHDISSEYGTLLHIIYGYAKSEVNENDERNISIGNQMRRALEAYLTFTYNKGINDVFNNEFILSHLVRSDEISYYNENLYILLMNGESHTQDQALTAEPLQSRYSTEDKHKVAKALLCFLDSTNQRHLFAYFSDIRNDGRIVPIDDIRIWKEEIFGKKTEERFQRNGIGNPLINE